MRAGGASAPNLWGLGRRVTERPKYGVDSGLVPRPLGLEPLEYVLVNAQRNKCLGRRWLKAFSYDAPHDVFDIGRGMLRRGRARA